MLTAPHGVQFKVEVVFTIAECMIPGRVVAAKGPFHHDSLRSIVHRSRLFRTKSVPYLGSDRESETEKEGIDDSPHNTTILSVTLS